LLALFAIASLSGDDEPGVGDGALRVAVLQGNIEQGVKWDPAWVERTLQIYEELSRRAAAQGAEVIVFPESSIPGALNEDPQLRRRMAELARETRAALVVGSVAIEHRVGSARQFFDSAFLLDPGGVFLDRYDKAHLVPFGEYIPFQEVWGGLLQAIAQGIALAGVTPGPGPRALELVVPGPQHGGGARRVSAGVPICYELLFPDLVRRFVGDGAGVLLAITNDAWYGRTGAPLQFLAMTAVRSAENGVWTARAANTGVSAIIDSRGQVLEQTGLFERDLRVADIPLRPPPLGGTFYTRFGDVFVIGCWLVAGALGIAARVRGNRSGSARSAGEARRGATT
jgi:apolipoprotein N-acyltransferase